MKQYFTALTAAFLYLIFCGTSCTESTSIGSDLLEGDLQDLRFTNDFELETQTLQADSVRVFSPILSSQLAEYNFGTYIDPIFGKVSSSIYAQVSLNGAGPDFSGATVDSVVLVLPYVVDYEFGDIDSEYGVNVLRINEDVEAESTLWSDTTFSTEPIPIGTANFTPRPTLSDSINIEVPENDTLGFETERVAPQLRITLNDDYANELFNADTLVFASDTSFTNVFQGIHIVPTTENDGLFAFNIRANADAGVFVYYSTSEKNAFYRFPFASSDLKMTNYQHDYAGSVTQTILDSPNDADSLFFVQGFGGVSGQVELQDLSVLEGDIAINKAELVLRVADLPEDEGNFATPDQLILAYQNEDGVYFVTEDVANATSANQSTLTSSLSVDIFGGAFVEGENGEPATYTLNVTAYLQNVLRGDISRALRISAYLKQRFANRVVFYGDSHSQYAPELRVSYTRFD